MSNCNDKECSWVWANKVSDIYVPAWGVLDQYQYVDVQFWVCETCKKVKAEVD